MFAYAFVLWVMAGAEMAAAYAAFLAAKMRSGVSPLPLGVATFVERRHSSPNSFSVIKITAARRLAVSAIVRDQFERSSPSSYSSSPSHYANSSQVYLN